MRSCPSDQSLRMLADDGLDPALFEAIEEHIAGCSACRARLEQLARECPRPSHPAPCWLADASEVPAIHGFTIEGEIGRGSTGVVYRAWDPTLSRPVALKVMQIAPGADQAARRRWRNEAKAFSRVRHPSIVVLHDIGEAGSWLYLVLEYIPGGTLKDRLSTTPMPPAEAARLVATVAEAVHDVHQAGILHLDLKPSNILLDGEPDAPLDRAIPKVSDFSIARRLVPSDQTATATAGDGFGGGTPSYMAPEQVDGPRDRLGPSADVHALGAILYRMVTGRPPFQGETMLETLSDLRTRDPLPPRQLIPRLSRDLQTIILKCLDKSPGKRYPTALAVAEDLRRWLDRRPIQARPVSIWERGGRWCRRHPAVAALSAAFLVALVGGFLEISVLWQRAERERGHAERERGRAERERSQALAARGRAEAEVKTTLQLVGQLIELNASGWGCSPGVMSLEDTAVLLQNARRQLLDRASRMPGDIDRLFAQLFAVDARLKSVLDDLGRLVEMRPLLEESVREAEAALRRDPRIIAAWSCLADHHITLASIAEMQGQANDCEAHLRRAVVSAEEWSRLDSGGESLSMLSYCRKSLARGLTSWGRHDEARDLLIVNQQTLLRCPAESVIDRIVAERVIGDLEFHHLSVGAPAPPAVEETGLAGSGAALGLLGADDLTPADWARMAIASFHLDDGSLPRNCREADVGYWFVRGFFEIIVNHRRRGQLDRARRTADRLLAFARLLVDRNPKEPIAYLALSEAYVHQYKNAYRPHEDRPAIERNLKLAIAAAQDALERAPHDSAARNQVDRLRRKLHDFLNP